MAHTSWPDNTRSLPTGYLDLGNEYLLAQSLLHFLGGRAFKEKLKGLAQVVPGPLDGVSLTGDVQLGTKGHVPISLAVNNGSQSLAHKPSGTMFSFLARPMVSSKTASDHCPRDPNHEHDVEDRQSYVVIILVRQIVCRRDSFARIATTRTMRPSTKPNCPA
jgi:hypothetical protein